MRDRTKRVYERLFELNFTKRINLNLYMHRENNIEIKSCGRSFHNLCGVCFFFFPLAFILEVYAHQTEKHLTILPYLL